MAEDPEKGEQDPAHIDPVEVEEVEGEEEEEETETPFDHPLFLPLLLGGLSLWFFYDGFINQDPEMLKHLSWNRYGFAASALATLWYGYKGWQELRERPSDKGI